jgi:hypothetical protein
MRALLTALVMLLAVAACSRLTAENYAKLKIGMSYEETKGILGSPDRCSDALGVKSCIWGNEARNIRVNFVGEKIILFTAENVR